MRPQWLPAAPIIHILRSVVPLDSHSLRIELQSDPML